MARRIAVMFRLDRADKQRHEWFRGIQRYAAQAGHWDLELDPFATRRAADYHGIIGPGSREGAAACRRAAVPLVTITWTSDRAPMTRVVENRQRAGRLAARHLLERGYTSFVCFSFSTNPHARLLREGFQEQLWRRGRGLGTILFPMKYSAQPSHWDVSRGWFADVLDGLTPPVGILACRDILARYLAQLCRRKGLRIPGDVGLIGAGDDPIVCTYPQPALTSIDFAYPRVGYRAAQLLDRLMDGQPPPIGNVLIAPTLIARASTDRRRRDDPLVADALRHIAQHCHRPLRVADIAAAVGVGPRHLLRRFHRIRGRTIVQEIARVRLDRAKSLLASTDLDLSAIARRCGYSSPRRMTQLFRRQEGCTPTAYRQRAAEP